MGCKRGGSCRPTDGQAPDGPTRRVRGDDNDVDCAPLQRWNAHCRHRRTAAPPPPHGANGIPVLATSPTPDQHVTRVGHVVVVLLRRVCRCAMRRCRSVGSPAPVHRCAAVEPWRKRSSSATRVSTVRGRTALQRGAGRMRRHTVRTCLGRSRVGGVRGGPRNGVGMCVDALLPSCVAMPVVSAVAGHTSTSSMLAAPPTTEDGASADGAAALPLPPPRADSLPPAIGPRRSHGALPRAPPTDRWRGGSALLAAARRSRCSTRRRRLGGVARACSSPTSSRWCRQKLRRPPPGEATRHRERSSAHEQRAVAAAAAPTICVGHANGWARRCCPSGPTWPCIRSPRPDRLIAPGDRMAAAHREGLDRQQPQREQRRGCGSSAYGLCGRAGQVAAPRAPRRPARRRCRSPHAAAARNLLGDWRAAAAHSARASPVGRIVEAEPAVAVAPAVERAHARACERVRIARRHLDSSRAWRSAARRLR